jgi:hypothetical protein
VDESTTPETGYVREEFAKALKLWVRDNYFYELKSEDDFIIKCFENIWNIMHELYQPIWIKNGRNAWIYDRFVFLMNYSAMAIVFKLGYWNSDKTIQAVWIERTYADAYRLWWKKHQNYGPNNISTFGIRGCYIRMWDKVQRLNRLIRFKETNQLQDETIIDTFLDIINYSVISILVMAEKWPKSILFTAEEDKI